MKDISIAIRNKWGNKKKIHRLQLYTLSVHEYYSKVDKM